MGADRIHCLVPSCTETQSSDYPPPFCPTHWTQLAADLLISDAADSVLAGRYEAGQLLGQRIVSVRAMNDDEAAAEHWERVERPAVLVLSSGVRVYAAADPTARDPGEMLALWPDGTSLAIVAD